MGEIIFIKACQLKDKNEITIKKLNLLLLNIIWVIVGGCFQTPTWESDITIPLISRTFTVSSLIDTNYFNINNDSTIDFYLSGELDTIFPLDSIRIADRVDSSFTALSDFVIRNLSTNQIGLNAVEITNLPIPDTFVYLNLPAFERTLEKTLIMNNIGSVNLLSGIMRINVTNNSHLRFDSIMCSFDGVCLLNVTNLDSMSVNEYNCYLDSIVLDSVMSFTVFLRCNGTGNDSIPIVSYDSLIFSSKLDSVRIESGIFCARPPKIVRTAKRRIYSLPINYQVRINDLHLSNGQLSLSLNNQFPFTCSSAINIPEFDFDTAMVISEFNTTNFVLDLTNRFYHNESLALAPITLNYVIEFLLDSVFVSIDDDNYYKLNYAFSDIEFDSIAATFIDTITHSFSSDTISIDIPDFLSQVQSVAAIAMLEVTNGINFPLILNLNMLTKNEAGDSAVVDTSFYILSGTPTNPSVSNLAVNFNNLINIHPNRAVLQATLLSYGSGTLTRQSFVTARYTIMSPLRLILRADTLYFDHKVNIDKKIRDLIVDNIDTSRFYAMIQNHLPTALAGQFVMKNQNHDSVQININIPSGSINNAGYVISPRDTNLVIMLTKEQSQIFTDSLLYVSVVIYLPDTDTITITGRDYLKIIDSYAIIQTLLP